MVKKVGALLIAIIFAIMAITILADNASVVYNAANATANNATLPAVERTVFAFLQWSPMVFLAIGVLLAVVGAMGLKFGRGGRRFRRRR